MQTESEKIISDLDFGQRYTQCGNCSMLTLCHGMYDDCVFSKAIRHIQHQDAELKALTISNKHRLNAWTNTVAEKEKAEVEVIKKFAELLTNKIFPLGLIDNGNYTINAKAIKVAIDNIKKEMVGEAK